MEPFVGGWSGSEFFSVVKFAYNFVLQHDEEFSGELVLTANRRDKGVISQINDFYFDAASTILVECNLF